MSRFLTASKAQLTEYVPGEQPKRGEFIKLNTNENPFPPSAEAVKGVGDVAAQLNIYNDTKCTRLTEVFADYHGVDSDCVIFSNGSDEILAFCYLAYCDMQNGLLYPEITYGFYEVFSRLFEVNGAEVPLCDDFTINIKDYFGCNRTVLIANPNAPTGIALSLDEIEQIIINNPNNIVIIDEAYIAFGGDSAMPLTKKYDNLIVVGTFSKARSMAGARLGYAVANSELIADLNRIKFSFNPYNVNAMTQYLGAVSIERDDYFKQCVNEIVSVRDWFVCEIAKLGFRTLPSLANFVFTTHDSLSGKEVYNHLRNDKILVRYFDGEKVKDFVRISIGTKSDMVAVVESLSKML